jgi:hypothetical protein
MVKLLLILVCSLILGAALLELRQQRLELNYETNKLHNEIRANQAKLWNQQIQIAIYTAPNAISKTVGDQQLNMVPQTPQLPGSGKWTDPKDDPAAE